MKQHAQGLSFGLLCSLLRRGRRCNERSRCKSLTSNSAVALLVYKVFIRLEIVTESQVFLACMAPLDEMAETKLKERERGETGKREKGEKGEVGRIGENGQVGPQGIVGPKGNSGKVGARGAMGPRGMKGVGGSKGSKGDQGVEVQENWKQCVWDRRDDKDSGVIQV